MRIGIVKKAFVQQIFFLIDFERPFVNQGLRRACFFSLKQWKAEFIKVKLKVLENLKRSWKKS